MKHQLLHAQHPFLLRSLAFLTIKILLRVLFLHSFVSINSHFSVWCLGFVVGGLEAHIMTIDWFPLDEQADARQRLWTIARVWHQEPPSSHLQRPSSTPLKPTIQDVFMPRLSAITLPSFSSRVLSHTSSLSASYGLDGEQSTPETKTKPSDLYPPSPRSKDGRTDQNRLTVEEYLPSLATKQPRGLQRTRSNIERSQRSSPSAALQELSPQIQPQTPVKSGKESPCLPKTKLARTQLEQFRPGLHAHQSYNQTSPSEKRGRSTERRCVSAEVANKASAHFSSPDRFITPRSSPFSQDSPFRSSKDSHSLSSIEKYNRTRDYNQDPFRTHNASRSRQAIRRISRRTNAPHFVPHFVIEGDQNELSRDARDNFNIQRQVSAGGVWNVGGPSPVYAGPLPAVEDGRGGLLGSGTTAPLHVAHFLDQQTPDEDIERHRSRLSVAMDIDEAQRVLAFTSSQTSRPLRVPSGSRNSPHIWRDGSWMREGAINRTFSRLCISNHDTNLS